MEKKFAKVKKKEIEFFLYFLWLLLLLLYYIFNRQQAVLEKIKISKNKQKNVFPVLQFIVFAIKKSLLLLLFHFAYFITLLLLFHFVGVTVCVGWACATIFGTSFTMFFRNFSGFFFLSYFREFQFFFFFLVFV